MQIPKQSNVLYPSPEAKLAQSQAIRRVYRQASKLLPGFVIKAHFNKGGIAVYGETYGKIYNACVSVNGESIPVAEAYDTSMGLLVRQWDGSHSGANHYVQTLEQFVALVKELASKPFVRF
jgi:hypothetical protein